LKVDLRLQIGMVLDVTVALWGVLGGAGGGGEGH
jgi:hypothetical protein